MSAKNWARCPRCLRRAAEERQKKRAAAEAAYGVVPHFRFLLLNEEATKPIVHRDTLREDYQVGITEEGMFYVRYRGECEECDFGYEHKFERRAEPGKD